MMRFLRCSLILPLISCLILPAHAEEKITFQQAWSKVTKYQGRSVPGVDTSTLLGKVVVGYQGWQNTPKDGADLGWRHYLFNKSFEPGHTCIDYWPDTSELTSGEKAATPFHKADGSVACVYSARNEQTVLRHFQWMHDYNIDSAFQQRFLHNMITDPKILDDFNHVLMNCRRGANMTGGSYAVMYDLSGVPPGWVEKGKQDWRNLVDKMGIGRDPNDKAYLHHRGKPLVVIWGVGMGQKNSKPRSYTLAECEEFIRFIKNDPNYGGNAIMLGIPSYWRTLGKDSLNDPRLHDVLKLADVLSPWTPGRYKSIETAEKHAEMVWKEDFAWCQREKIDYLPVVFPGFSCHNKNPDKPINEIPRLKGAFLWAQYAALAKLGIHTVYQAMFDEMDEGTQIFKVDQDPPIGASHFLTYEGLGSDYYLWLVQQAKKMITGETPVSKKMPVR